MTCPACSLTIEKALDKVPGVTGQQIDTQAATVTVTFDPTRTTVPSVAHAITEAGFPAKVRGMATELQLQSTLTCPHCGHQRSETMPTNACLFFYDCAGCGELLRPKPGDCCVFCSYGTVPCPPIQQDKSCCRSA